MSTPAPQMKYKAYNAHVFAHYMLFLYITDSLRQIASNSNYLVFKANFMEGPAHAKPIHSLLFLCTA